jgi:hypothetical protein
MTGSYCFSMLNVFIHCWWVFAALEQMASLFFILYVSHLYPQISRVLDDASAAPGALEDDDDTSRAITGGTSTSTTRYCAPRLPVKVTKCGGQYPYDGAFVTGDVTMTSGPPLSVAALPWRRQDDDDACYRWGRNNACLFYFWIFCSMVHRT